VRVGNPLLTHALFPVYVAALAWGGLFRRDPRLGELLPLRTRPWTNARESSMKIG